MLTFWVWAPVVLFAVLAVGAVVWAVLQGREGSRAWVRTDWVAREMGRVVSLPRRVL